MGSKKKARAIVRKMRVTAKSSQATLADRSHVGFLDKIANSGARGLKTLAKAPLPKEQKKKMEILCASFHADDQPGLLCDYMKKHRSMDSKTLAKYMPNLCRDIQEGKVDDDAVSIKLMYEYKKRNPGFRYPETMLTSSHKMDRIGMRMADMILESFTNHRELLDGKEIERFRNSFSGIRQVYGRSHQEVHLDQIVSDMAVEIKHIVVEKCRNFEALFDQKLCGNVKGEFLRRCPILGLTTQQFAADFLMKAAKLEGWEDTLAVDLQIELRRASTGVSTGVLHESNCCWECGIVPPSKLLVCGRCNFASYCSQSCQKEAWKKGHKQTCSELRSRKERLQDDIRTIDKMTGKTNWVSDYVCLNTLNELHASLRRIIEDLGEPSMKTFYQNFDLVQRGAFWVIENPTPLDDYMKELALLGADAEVAEKDALVLATGLLTYDLLSFDEASNMYTLVAPHMGQFQSKMPRERFLHLYATAEPRTLPLNHTTHWKRHQRFLVKRIESNLRALYEYNGDRYSEALHQAGVPRDKITLKKERCSEALIQADTPQDESACRAEHCSDSLKQARTPKFEVTLKAERCSETLNQADTLQNEIACKTEHCSDSLNQAHIPKAEIFLAEQELEPSWLNWFSGSRGGKLRFFAIILVVAAVAVGAGWSSDDIDSGSVSSLGDL